MQERMTYAQEKIREAYGRVSRNPEEVTLVAVNKTKPVGMLLEAYEARARDSGENKVWELAQKRPLLLEDTCLHTIGHLQISKVKRVTGQTALIHSVDPIHLAEQIEVEVARCDLAVNTLLKVNVAKEESKFEFYLEETEGAPRKIGGFPHVKVQGLMTIVPFAENSEENRPVFRKLCDFYVDMKSKNIGNIIMGILSMGMIDNYEATAEGGTTVVRVGADIFGAHEKMGDQV